MHDFLSDLAARRRFGMKPGLDAIFDLSSALNFPHKDIRAIHVAGTNGKGAVCAILDSCLREMNYTIGRYTSPHLVKINERFFLNGKPIADEVLSSKSQIVASTIEKNNRFSDITFFEALTAIAFLLYADTKPDFTILETGLGGRLDATNICSPIVSVITHIGLDHCDWLGDTLQKIASEKAGIIKANVPVVLGENPQEVVEVIRTYAEKMNSPFFYAPQIVSDDELPNEISLKGSFNRENAKTALAVMKVLASYEKINEYSTSQIESGLTKVVWPGRFHKVGRYIIDGAHNPPAAEALVKALDEMYGNKKFILIAGFCGDKDVNETLRILSPKVLRAYAVRTNNSRSLDPVILADKMRSLNIQATPCNSLKDAMKQSFINSSDDLVLICGSLFLSGEAIVECNAYPWGNTRFDSSELLRT